jgi:hypothetical protein
VCTFSETEPAPGLQRSDSQEETTAEEQEGEHADAPEIASQGGADEPGAEGADSAGEFGILAFAYLALASLKTLFPKRNGVSATVLRRLPLYNETRGRTRVEIYDMCASVSETE